MARKKYWVGSQGPYFYDDTDDVHDPDGAITEKQSGIVSEGVIKSLEAPVANEDVVRLDDLDGDITNLMRKKRTNRTIIVTDNILVADEIIWADASSGSIILTLPTAVSIGGQEFIVYKTDSSANTVTVNTILSQTINGVATYVFSIQYDSTSFRSNGSNYIIGY